MNKHRNDEYVAGILYNDSLRRELEWRQNESNAHDVFLFDKMLSEINLLGYNYMHYADITMRHHTDPTVVEVIERYIGRFQNEGITGELVRAIGVKGNESSLKTMLNCYFNTSEDMKRKNAGFYDNAISNIKDDRYIDSYLRIISDVNNAARFPFTMQMLGKWRNEDAKALLIRYLSSENAQLVWNSLGALKFYKDDPAVISALESSVGIERSNPKLVKDIATLLSKMK